jgi:hypothetical protein
MPKQSHEVQRTYVWKLSTSMLSDFAHCVDLYVSGSRSSHGSHSTDIGPHQAHEACAMRREVVEAKRQFSNTTLSFRYDLFTNDHGTVRVQLCLFNPGKSVYGTNGRASEGRYARGRIPRSYARAGPEVRR